MIDLSLNLFKSFYGLHLGQGFLNLFFNLNMNQNFLALFFFSVRANTQNIDSFYYTFIHSYLSVFFYKINADVSRKSICSNIVSSILITQRKYVTNRCQTIKKPYFISGIHIKNTCSLSFIKKHQLFNYNFLDGLINI